MTTLQDTLEQRGSTHGVFCMNSRISQQLKHHIRNEQGYNRLTYAQKEALDMIMHKISRILAGDPKFIDSWRDIAGYAQLVVDELYKDPMACDAKSEKFPIIAQPPF